MISTVVGNYPKTPNWPREARLRKAWFAFDQKQMSTAELRSVEDEVTLEVIKEQVDAGVELITDGQVRWKDPLSYFAAEIDGFLTGSLSRYFDTPAYYHQPVAERSLTWAKPILRREYDFAREHSPRPVKVVVTGPYTLAKLSINEHYPDFEAFVLAVAEILNQEARSLLDQNPPLIQFDEPAIVWHKDDFPIFREAAEVVTRDITTKTAVYTYFGDVSGLYPKLLELPFDVIGLDFVRGEENWEVIRQAPFSKELGFGIVDGQNPASEGFEELVKDIHRVSEVVPVERLYVNPNCGLAFLPRDRAKAKLENMVAAVEKA